MEMILTIETLSLVNFYTPMNPRSSDPSPFGSSVTLSLESNASRPFHDLSSMSDMRSNEQTPLENDQEDDDNEENREDASDEEPVEQYDEHEDDPLGVKRLALSFDYLIYQITERVDALAIQTEETVKYKKRIAEDQLKETEESIAVLTSLLQTCEDLDNDFAKLEQISFIVSDFKQRIRHLEEYFKKK